MKCGSCLNEQSEHDRRALEWHYCKPCEEWFCSDCWDEGHDCQEYQRQRARRSKSPSRRRPITEKLAHEVCTDLVHFANDLLKVQMKLQGGGDKP